MPQNITPGGAWSERDKTDLVREVMSGALSVSDACARHGLSQECLRDWVRQFRHSAVEAFDEHLRQTLGAQGMAVGDVFAAGFNGSLSDMALADLIQTMTLARRDGVITLSQDGVESRIWCADGEIVDAASGPLRGAQALYRALALKSGRVIAEFVAAARTRTIFDGVSSLLLEGARRMDECEVLSARLGAGRYRRAPSSAEVEPGTSERALLELFSAPSTLREAVAQSDMGDLEALSGMARLIEQGYLCAGSEPSTPPIATRASDPGSTAPVMLSFLRPGGERPFGLNRRQRRLGVGLALSGLTVLGFWVGWSSLGGLSGSSQSEAAASATAASALAARPAPAASVAPLVAAPRGAEPLPPVPAPAAAPAESAAATDTVPTAAAPTATPVTGAPRAASGHRGRARAVAAAAATAVAEPAPSRRAPRPAAAAVADSEGAARSSPRMQIIDEQNPRMQIVE